MARILTCTWAPTVLDVPHMLRGYEPGLRQVMTGNRGPELQPILTGPVQQAEALGIDYLLVAQRWWGSGREIEGSTYDCLAMTAFYAAQTERIKLVTAVHPGFFLPAPIAKWGATLDCVTGGRWAINVTSGWHLDEFPMYGAELPEHDQRYARSAEFIEILRGAWQHETFDYQGHFYQLRDLRLEPRPGAKLEVFQGGQSPAAIEMAARHSDWMFLNGGPPQKVGPIIEEVRRRAAEQGREVRFALYGIPLCRETDAEAEAEVAAMLDALDPEMVARREHALRGAQGMWSSTDDPLSLLDTNEGYTTGLIGSPDTILARMRELHALGIDCFHLTLHDPLFNEQVLPKL